MRLVAGWHQAALPIARLAYLQSALFGCPHEMSDVTAGFAPYVEFHAILTRRGQWVTSTWKSTDCAGRYLAQRRERRSLATMQIHVRLLLPHIGDLEPHQVHDATLAPFIASRVAVGASATTINRSLEVVRAILNRAARSYRDADGTPWLTGIPSLITMLPESRRPPTQSPGMSRIACFRGRAAMIRLSVPSAKKRVQAWHIDLPISTCGANIRGSTYASSLQQCVSRS